MRKSAFIFPGQGVQYVGMGKDFFESYPVAKETFLEASEELSFDIAKLCFEGPAEELASTKNSQPAILVTSVAMLRAFKSARGKKLLPSVCAGLSLGEYSALVAAGCVSFRDAVRLVSNRGRLMEEASSENPGKMAAIIGLEVKVVEEITREAGSEIANLNCPGQVIISGSSAAVEKTIEIAKQRGIVKSVLLAVRGPFHSSLMTKASDSLKQELDKINFSKPAIPFISNVTAVYIDDVRAIKENLALQVNHRTLWENSVRLMMKDGVTDYYEIGPGKVLKGLLKKIDRNLNVHSIETVADLSA